MHFNKYDEYMANMIIVKISQNVIEKHLKLPTGL